MANSNQKIMAYRRENGRVGVRNHVIILPVDDISNAACEAVGNNIKGTMALPHSYGRLQFGADLDLHFRTMIGTGSNPNVAAVYCHRHRTGMDAADRCGWNCQRQVNPSPPSQSSRMATLIRSSCEASHKAKQFVHWAT